MNTNHIDSMKKSLFHLQGKTIEKILQVDYNQDRDEDIYLPWLFMIVFSDDNRFLTVEGDLDGFHLKLNFFDKSELEKKIQENNFPDEHDLWHVYETQPEEVLAQLVGAQIHFIEYGLDESEFIIDETNLKEKEDVFCYIRLHTNRSTITIYEGAATGLVASDNIHIPLIFADNITTCCTK